MSLSQALEATQQVNEYQSLVNECHTDQQGCSWYLLDAPQEIPQALCLLLAAEYQCPSIAKQESQDALEIPDEPPCYAKN